MFISRQRLCITNNTKLSDITDNTIVITRMLEKFIRENHLSFFITNIPIIDILICL
jgi:hypothetical protein